MPRIAPPRLLPWRLFAGLAAFAALAAAGGLRAGVADSTSPSPALTSPQAQTSTGPTPIYRVGPAYPALAQYEAIQGTAVVCFTVTSSGSVADAHVKSVPHSYTGNPKLTERIRHEFSAAVLHAIRQWKFTPRRVDGKPASTPGICQKMVFQLQ